MCYTVETFQFLLGELDKKLATNDEHGYVIIVDGAAMALVYGIRDSTRDIDAIFEPKIEMLSYIREIADEQEISYDWLNDSVKGASSIQQRYVQSHYTYSTI